jgi:CubicO group peptidase (beta-lactamase class C family)
MTRALWPMLLLPGMLLGADAPAPTPPTLREGGVGAGDTIPAAVPAWPGADWGPADPTGIDAALMAQALDSLRGFCGPEGVQRTMIVIGGRPAWQGDGVNVCLPVWSCTKSVLSTCLGLLWDDGRCTPDTRISTVMPELAAAYPEVTLGHLATFTSGYNHAVDRPLEPAAPAYRPGTAFHYSSQSDLLAALLTRIAGEPLADLFRRRIGDPIGMEPGEFRWGVQPGAEPPVHGGSGMPPAGVQVSARALARFGLLHCRRGVWRGRRLLGQAYLDAAQRVQVPSIIAPFQPGAWYQEVLGRYGLNWWVNGVGNDGRRLWPSAPATAFAAQGNLNNICIVVPEWDLVLVRLGLDRVVPVTLYDAPLLYLRRATGDPLAARPPAAP